MARGVHPPAHHPRRGLVDWVELIFKDHGFLRIIWHNLHEIRPGVWRSNQPAPRDIRRAARLGVKTIINLRGPRRDGGWRLEKEACDRYGITLVDVTVRSRDVPDAETVRNINALFKSVKPPFLMHCKSGADRAGLVSALYLLLVEKTTVDEALDMLSLRFLHARQAKTGLLDAFIEAYRPAQERGVDFVKWAETELNPADIKSNFMASGWASRLVDGILKRE
jgi:protein tyrosine phosphatase (PTP) superfamily phosphohydrolase (DUF442 family)